MTKDYLARQFKNYHEITGNVVTPQIYGAKADGITDDTNAVSQALNSGSAVYIPKGKYLVSWGKISINDSTKDIVIYGDGEDSILLFNPLHKHPDTGAAAHGFMIRNRNDSSNRVNIYIHDIQIRYENSDTSITYPSDEARLFGCVGYFKNIILDHVYMHDSVTTSTTPKDSLMWLQIDADNVIVSNSKFENFTNNIIGGCVWINSGYFGVNYHINNISIINNILRNTNQDEAIAVWALPEGLIDIDNIVIDGNEIVHKNWNGECTASHSVIGIATLSNSQVINKSYTISNNTITTEKISQGVIRNIGVDKLLISDNTITISSADSNATTINLIENYKNAYSVIKDNHIEITGVTKKLILFSQQGNIDYINNVFETSNNVQLASYGDDNYDVQKVLNFIGNTIVFRTPTTSLFEVNNHGIWLTMNIVNNEINGGLRLIANSTQNTKVQNNVFNIDNEVSTVALEASKVLSFIDNKNIVLEINNTNITTKMTAFKYSGLKNGLVFKVGGSVVDDSAEVRNRFFTVADIVYEGVPSGGTTSQVLVKKSDADYDVEWGKNALDEFTILTPKNLMAWDDCKANFRPDATVGTSTYSDGTTVQGIVTTNLIPCTSGQKFKINLITDPSYLRCFFYRANEVLDSIVLNYSFTEDGYVTFTAPTRNTIAYLAVVSDEIKANTVIDYYDSFALENETIVNDLYFSDKNISMAKKLLGVEDVLKGKKWTVIGDSFTAGGWTSQDTPSYILDGPYAGKLAVYPYLIATRCGMKIQDLSMGGRTMALAPDSANSNSVINHYQRTAVDADYLTIYIGINDSHMREAEIGQIPLGEITDTTTATFYGAYNTVLTWLITNRPNLHIGLIVSNGCETDDYRVATIALANKYGLPYIDMNGDSRTPCMIRSTNANIDSAIRNQRTQAWRVSETNLHPNADAHVYESTFIENFLRSL